MDQEAREGEGGHSLRAGLATCAAANGATETVIMAQTGHKSTAMVRPYIPPWEPVPSECGIGGGPLREVGEARSVA